MELLTKIWSELYQAIFISSIIYILYVLYKFFNHTRIYDGENKKTTIHKRELTYLLLAISILLAYII